MSRMSWRVLSAAFLLTTLFSGSWGPVLGETEASAQPVPSFARLGVRSCSEAGSLRSEKSTEPTKITFVNRSGMYRKIIWINYQGGAKDYGGLNPGETKTVNTFRTHPWIIATGPGNCLQIILPAAEPATAVLK